MRILSLLICYLLMHFANQKTESPHGPDLKLSCTTCHSSKGWHLDKVIYSFNHNSTRMPLTGAHMQADCKSCHTKLIFKGTKTNCNECHTDIHQNTVGLECSRCHTTVSWLVNNITEVHRMSRFPLAGPHVTADCAQCHKSESLLRFDVAGVNCIDCHRQNYLATTNPNHVLSGISEDCFSCHPMNSFQWTGAGFDHSAFPLNLGHSTVRCYDCHASKNFKEAKTDCYSCHQKDFLATKNPNHVTAQMQITCQDCHTLNPGWTPAAFDHTKFPLTLGHSTPACIDCHKGGNYITTATDCYSCHQQNYTATSNPNHTATGYSKSCESCHTTVLGWKPAVFNHSAFPLTLGHATVICSDCHKNGVYANTSTDCYSCHQSNYTSTTNPNHVGSGIPTTCSTCHTTNPGWTPASVSHAAFPLTLGHASPTCNDCHKGNYTSTSTDCYSCHQTDYSGTTNPGHQASGIPTACLTCHTTTPGWAPAKFNHGTFPLTLGHSVPTCNDCHKGNYTSTSNTCYSCHQTDFTSSISPNHVAAGMSQVCSTCHTTAPGWAPAAYTHNAGFSLTLGHASVACNDCHKGNYTTTSTDCYSCHQAAYIATTNPNHTASGIPTTCSTCHTTAPGWTPATFSHTGFSLTLGHSTVACNDCHKGNYANTSTDCYSCHQSNYTGTTNPNHTTSGIPTTCSTCHTTAPGWTPATFTHTAFPLTLGHATPTCNACHNGNYTTTSTDCYACHQADYTNSTNPSHVTLKFATICTQCHTTKPGWTPATYTAHDTQFFPIYSGRHLGRWSQCTDCHTNPSNYALFDCIHCHQGVHSGKNYTNAQCYSCHPRGIAN